MQQGVEFVGYLVAEVCEGDAIVGEQGADGFAAAECAFCVHE